MSNSQLRILWIVPKWPLPATDGARLAICNLLEALSMQTPFEIAILALCGTDEKVDINDLKARLGVKEVFVIDRPATPGSIIARTMQMLMSFLLAPTRPVTMRNYAAESISREMISILKLPWDLVVFDTLHSAYPLLKANQDLSFMSCPSFYRAHNHEQGIWKSREVRSKWALPRVFLKFQHKLMKRLEDRLVASVDAVLCVSSQDCQRFETLSNGKGKCYSVPIGVLFKKLPVNWDKKPIQLTFLGKLDWPPNYDGLRWFLEKVWPIVSKQRSDITLSIVGSGDCANLQDICTKLTRVNFRGFVKDLQDVMQSSDAFIVPIFYGSGTRVKAIQAASSARCCVSTALGVEGLGFSEDCHYFRAESEQEWISLLTTVTRSELLARGTAAYDYLEQEFDKNFIANKLQFQIESFFSVKQQSQMEAFQL